MKLSRSHLCLVPCEIGPVPIATLAAEKNRNQQRQPQQRDQSRDLKHA
jgi:hypothetical protein